MGSLESGLEKKCCLSPTRRNGLGTKGRTTFQVPERVRQNIHRLKGNLMRQTSIDLGNVLMAQERM